VQKHADANGPQTLWRKHDVARYCRVNIRTIENWMAHQGLPHFKVANVVLFNQHDVLQFLEKRRRVVAD
jgi:hypothetical protein